MKVFIVPVPVFDSEMAVVAYHLVFQSGNKLFGLSQDYAALTEAMYSPGTELINEIGVEPFTGGKPVLVDINQFQFLADVPRKCAIDPALFVCVVARDLPLKPYIFGKCEALKADGYKLAVNNVPYNAQSAQLYQYADYIMLDSRTERYKDIFLYFRKNYKDTNILFTYVRDQAFFDRMHTQPRVQFEGDFYSVPLTRGSQKISALKTNALQLLQLVKQDDFDLDAVSHVIKRDPTFTISLLKFINSPAVGIRQKINSINGAVALLGQKETRKWITVAVSTHLGTDKPSELTKLSLVRAKFAENLATAFEMGVLAPSLFLAGLFSLLDVMLDMPMEQAIKEVSVDQKLKEALADRKGPIYEVLDLIDSYEHANWEAVSVVIIRRDIDLEEISKAYIDALIWYKELISAAV